MLTITGFADEISADLEEQIKGVKELGFRYIELRGAWGKNVLQLTNEEVERAIGLLKRHDCGISSIASPLGKYPIGDDFAPQLTAAKRAIELAHKFGTKYIRIFSYYIPKGEDPAAYRDEAIRRVTALAGLAETAGVTLILENDSGGLYGDIDERVYDLVTAANSPALRLAFDPGNFIMDGVAPMVSAYGKLAPYIAYIHIKDAKADVKMFVEAGQGDGGLPALIRKLQDRGFSGFLSIEPHLHKVYPEKSSAERFDIAANALKKLLEEASAAWQ